MSYRIDPRMPFTLEVRRILGEEIGKVLEHLERVGDRPEQSLHGCRKRLKAVRALLRLVRGGDEAFYEVENARYRDVSALLAEARQATALVETLERLAVDFPDVEASGGFASARQALLERQHGALRGDEGLDLAISTAIAACRDGLRSLDRLTLPDEAEAAADILAEGARLNLRRARKALERSRSRGSDRDFHNLRKAAKAHGLHLALLGRMWPSPVKARRQAVDDLGDRLGDLHDVFVMRALAAAGDECLGGPEQRKLLDKLLRRSEKTLRKHCLRAARDLFEESPRRAVRKLARTVRAELVRAPAVDGSASVLEPAG